MTESEKLLRLQAGKEWQEHGTESRNVRIHSSASQYPAITGCKRILEGNFVPYRAYWL
jgi:hypothetical protein